MRKSIKEVRRVAHLCPPMLRGVRSCWVNRLINQPWRVKRRLLSQRSEGVGRRIHGRVKARRIKGTPIKTGLKN